MLTQVTTDKPSELLAFVKIPVDMATTIVGIPAELLKIRVDQHTTEQILRPPGTTVAPSTTGDVKPQ